MGHLLTRLQPSCFKCHGFFIVIYPLDSSFAIKAYRMSIIAFLCLIEPQVPYRLETHLYDPSWAQYASWQRWTFHLLAFILLQLVEVISRGQIIYRHTKELLTLMQEAPFSGWWFCRKCLAELGANFQGFESLNTFQVTLFSVRALGHCSKKQYRITIENPDSRQTARAVFQLLHLLSGDLKRGTLPLCVSILPSVSGDEGCWEN